jgi:cell division protein ZapB
MEAELNALEQKINQTVGLCQRLRAENQQLRQQLAAATNENKQLADKVSEAKSRLESLLRQIPENPQ